MSSVWEILGLPADQRDERSIKRAYAKLLKQHRPDQDPEGFRRVHDAYQRALAMANNDEEDDDDDDDDDVVSASNAEHRVTATAATLISTKSSLVVEPPVQISRVDQGAETPTDAVPQPPVDQAPSPVVENPPEVKQVPAPTSWDRALGDLELVAGQPSGQLRDEALTAVFRRLARLVTERQGSAAVLVLLLNRHLAAGRMGWRHIFSDEDLLAELRRGESELAGHTLRGCFEAGDWERLRVFAERWMELDADELQSGDAVALTRVLAVWLAPFDYHLADRLVGYLPMQQRRQADNELDTLLAVGRDASVLPQPSRKYVCALLVGRPPPDDEDLKWRTGGLLSQLPPDSMLRRMLGERAAEHFAGLAASTGTDGGINLLSLLMTFGGLMAWGLGLALLITLLGAELARTWGALASIPFAMVVFLVTRWLYRRVLPAYQTRWRPWLWSRFGPFDWPLFFVVVYCWLTTNGMLVRLLEPSPWIVVVWSLAAPFVIITLTHHLRRLMRRYSQVFPPWSDIPGRIKRVQRLFNLHVTVSKALSNGWQILTSIASALPAMVGALIYIGGFAFCPPFQFSDPLGGAVTVFFWSGPAILIMAALHAWWLRWREQGRRPWWWPLVLLGGCVFIPGVTWLVVFGPHWLGWSQAPLGIWWALLAWWLAVDLTVGGGLWLAKRVSRRTG